MSDEFLARLERATPRTWVTAALIVANLLVWLANLATGLSPWLPSPLELAAWGANFLPLTREQPWRLATAAFLHAGAIHLAFNLWALWDAGRLAERFYGNAQFAIIYGLSALGGSVASLHFAASQAVSVGASGAIFGVVGAISAAILTKHAQMPARLVALLRSSLALFVGYSLFMGFTVPHIDNAAHLGGFATGAMLGAIMSETFDAAEFRAQGMLRAGVAVALVLTGLFVGWRTLPAISA